MSIKQKVVDVCDNMKDILNNYFTELELYITRSKEWDDEQVREIQERLNIRKNYEQSLLVSLPPSDEFDSFSAKKQKKLLSMFRKRLIELTFYKDTVDSLKDGYEILPYKVQDETWFLCRRSGEGK